MEIVEAKPGRLSLTGRFTLEGIHLHQLIPAFPRMRSKAPASRQPGAPARQQVGADEDVLAQRPRERLEAEGEVHRISKQRELPRTESTVGRRTHVNRGTGAKAQTQWLENPAVFVLNVVTGAPHRIGRL